MALTKGRGSPPIWEAMPVIMAWLLVTAIVYSALEPVFYTPWIYPFAALGLATVAFALVMALRHSNSQLNLKWTLVGLTGSLIYTCELAFAFGWVGFVPWLIVLLAHAATAVAAFFAKLRVFAAIEALVFLAWLSPSLPVGRTHAESSSQGFTAEIVSEGGPIRLRLSAPSGQMLGDRLMLSRARIERDAGLLVPVPKESKWTRSDLTAGAGYHRGTSQFGRIQWSGEQFWDERFGQTADIPIASGVPPPIQWENVHFSAPLVPEKPDILLTLIPPQTGATEPTVSNVDQGFQATAFWSATDPADKGLLVTIVASRDVESREFEYNLTDANGRILISHHFSAGSVGGLTVASDRKKSYMWVERFPDIPEVQVRMYKLASLRRSMLSLDFGRIAVATTNGS